MSYRIILTNTKCKLDIPLRKVYEIKDNPKFKLRVPGAYYSKAYHKRLPGGGRVWDGYKRYITDQGYFEAGYLQKVYDYLTQDLGKKVIIQDNREMIWPDELVTTVGDQELRGYQNEAYQAFFNNKVGKVQFPRGILDEATNAGKTLLASAIFLSYPESTQLVFLIHDKLVYKQTVESMEKLLGVSTVGRVDSKVIRKGRFTICMTPTLSSRIKDPGIQNFLAKADVCIVDECHRGTSKQYENVLKYLYNCPVRLGLSGTPFMHKDKNKNERLREFFGNPIHVVKNRRLIDEGYSTEPIIKMILGETRYKIKGDHREEYNKAITKNAWRHRLIWRRVRRALDKKRYPLLILCKYIDHAERVLKAMPEDLKEQFKIGLIHTDVKADRKVAILEKFKKGKIDILIATHLIQSGHNMPLIKFSINTGGADSKIVILQWLGRNLRKHKSKKYVYIEDIYDAGYYLGRHSKHRLRYYKEEKLKVNEMFKTQAKKKGIKL